MTKLKHDVPFTKSKFQLSSLIMTCLDTQIVEDHWCDKFALVSVSVQSGGAMLRGPHAYIYRVSGEEAEPLLIMDGLMEGSREGRVFHVPGTLVVNSDTRLIA